MASRKAIFLENLKNMQKVYPEYKDVLQFLIEQIQQENIANIQSNIQRLKEEDW